MKIKRPLLDDRQVHVAVKSFREFGWNVSFESVRKIANQIAKGTHSTTDPVALVLCEQIDEAVEAVPK